MIVLAKMSSIFWAIFSFQGKLLKLAILGAHLYQQFLRNPHYITPIRFFKNVTFRGSENPNFPNFVNRAIKPLGKISRMQKKIDRKNLFPSLRSSQLKLDSLCSLISIYCNTEPVDGPLKVTQNNGAKLQ